MAANDIDSISLPRDVAGDGPALVLVHGSWADRKTWGLVLPRLAESFRTISYDRRGHGESATRPDAGTVHDDVADLVRMIDEVGKGPAHVVASSYGACIALRMAAAYPDHVMRLVCHEPPMLGVLEIDEGGHAIADEVRRKFGEVRQRLERNEYVGGAEYFVEQVAFGSGVWSRMPPPVQETFLSHAPTFLGELRDFDAFGTDLDLLRRLDTPVLLTHGDHSPAFFAPIVERLSVLLPNAQKGLVPGAGHVPHLTHPDAYVSVTRDFLGAGPGDTP